MFEAGREQLSMDWNPGSELATLFASFERPWKVVQIMENIRHHVSAVIV